MYFASGLRRAALILIIGTCGAVGSHAQAPDAAAAARDARLRAARAQLATLVQETGADGRVVERSRGNYAVSPARADLPQAPIKNGAAVGALAIGPLLRVWGNLDENGALTVQRYTLAVAARRPTESADGALLPPDVRDASNQIIATVDAALRPGAMGVTERSLTGPSALSAEVRKNLTTIRTGYQQALAANAAPRAITAIVRQYVEARRIVADAFTQSDEHKALYRSAENYDPWRYDVIYRQARAVVAIGEPGDTTARCSGVLIADDLVLTAAHCFGGDRRKNPEELEVWFGYARLPGGNLPPLQRRPILDLVAPARSLLPKMFEGAFDSQLLDYAIVRFGKRGSDPLTPPDVAPQCLRSASLFKNDPIYVVGYPEGAPQMVHDSGRVYLPFRIFDGDLFFRLRLDVEADLIDSPDRAEFMKQFDSSYETVEETNGVKYRYFYHVKDGNQPRMGIVANTFQGDSGGPVFERERGQCVVGILVSGADDTGVRLNASWERHEHVLPATAILKDAERYDPNIRNKVTVE